jgi:hypothetical protein
MGLLAVGTVMAIRALLMVLGLYKSPILKTFERYGPDEKIYSPLLSFTVWFVLTVWIGMATLLSLGALFVIGVTAYVCFSMTFHDLDSLARKYPRLFLVYPRWYYALRERTSREERRRIAYLWLHLPRNLRLRYQTDTPAFDHWMEMVLISIVSE